MLTDEQLNQLEAAVRSGQLTEAEAIAFARKSVYEAYGLAQDITKAEAAAADALAQNHPAGFISRPATALAVSALEAEGLTTARARERVVKQGVEAFEAQIERQRNAEREAYEKRQALIAAEHPDEKRKRAAESMAAREKFQQDALLAREYLITEGFTEDDIALLTAEEAVKAAFSEPDHSTDDLGANLRAAGELA